MSTYKKKRTRSNLRFKKLFRNEQKKQVCFKSIEMLIVIFKLVDTVLKLIDKIK